MSFPIIPSPLTIAGSLFQANSSLYACPPLFIQVGKAKAKPFTFYALHTSNDSSLSPILESLGVIDEKKGSGFPIASAVEWTVGTTVDFLVVDNNGWTTTTGLVTVKSLDTKQCALISHHHTKSDVTLMLQIVIPIVVGVSLLFFLLLIYFGTSARAKVQQPVVVLQQVQQVHIHPPAIPQPLPARVPFQELLNTYFAPRLAPVPPPPAYVV